ncbi:TRAF-type zinc finger domain-containing protein 1-like [Falco cherrug]|uniref:TRAF-type zinc finger domain-containing protein 1-like n=1 Tax=Falco cherrug TaxID=345164 RepID=UPI00247AF35C|nr:TRAF-type zinc finger domain-containing protein 1-like [Falco cherrug]
MKNHFASEHVEVTCECGMKMEKQHLEDHKAFVCLLRLVLCPYCEIQLPLRAMVDHELYCSTRTEECENCHRYILVRDLKEHPRVCGLVGVQTRGSAPSDFEDEDAHLQDLRHSGRESGTDDEPVTLPCQSCGLRYPIYERMDHELVCVLRPAAEDSMPPKAKRQRQESAEPPWTRSKCQGTLGVFQTQ